MKQIVVASLLVVLLLSLSLVVVTAGEIWDDPVLCVAGQWLTVDAGAQPAVTVSLPDGTPFDEGAGCTLPPPDNTFITSVEIRPGNSPVMVVRVDGNSASQPDVVVTYGEDVKVKHNNNQPLTFTFNLH